MEQCISLNSELLYNSRPFTKSKPHVFIFQACEQVTAFIDHPSQIRKANKRTTNHLYYLKTIEFKGSIFLIIIFYPAQCFSNTQCFCQIWIGVTSLTPWFYFDWTPCMISNDKGMAVTLCLLKDGCISVDLNAICQGSVPVFITIFMGHITHKLIQSSILNTSPLVKDWDCWFCHLK